MADLSQGESVALGTRVDGGPTVCRDSLADDAYQIADHGGELYRDEIKRLAELAGLEVED